jgi:hypothetical protein
MNKPEHLHTPGLLQTLPIPVEALSSIGMDFITGLPKFEGKSVIMVVVDRLTKYAHFLTLAHPYTALEVATTFLDNIYNIYILTSNFWRELLKLLGVKLNMSTAYHPQSDGQTEGVNQCLENYLRGMLLDQQRKWTRWLPLA